jgi:hypothetical protein
MFATMAIPNRTGFHAVDLSAMSVVKFIDALSVAGTADWGFMIVNRRVSELACSDFTCLHCEPE